MIIQKYQRCKSYLLASRIKIDAPNMTDYWLAVLLTHKISERRYCAICPDGKLNAEAVFKEFENSNNRKVRKAHSRAEMKRLQPYIGCWGIKTSLLSTAEDYWVVAEILFKGRIDRACKLTLLDQIKAIPKKQRRMARCNIKGVPRKFFPCN